MLETNSYRGAAVYQFNFPSNRITLSTPRGVRDLSSEEFMEWLAQTVNSATQPDKVEIGEIHGKSNEELPYLFIESNGVAIEDDTLSAIENELKKTNLAASAISRYSSRKFIQDKFHTKPLEYDRFDFRFPNDYVEEKNDPTHTQKNAGLVFLKKILDSVLSKNVGSFIRVRLTQTQVLVPQKEEGRKNDIRVAFYSVMDDPETNAGHLFNKELQKWKELQKGEVSSFHALYDTNTPADQNGKNSILMNV